jgi:hypothetical protein
VSDVVPDVGRHAVLVDAGYLYASVGQLVLGRTSRREFRVAAEPLIGALMARADRTTPGGLLRMYWYDAARAPERQGQARQPQLGRSAEGRRRAAAAGPRAAGEAPRGERCRAHRR